MKLRWNFILPLAAATLAMGGTGCVSDPDSPGLEYMPDMYRSPAIEAYVDYGQDPYDVGTETAEQQRRTPSARRPVAGTIPFNPSEKAFLMPYAYPNTLEGYELAGLALKSPLTTSVEHAEAGKVIYEQMCSQCHGEKGAGDGALSRNGHIEGIPSYADKLKDLPEGKMFHTLTYGKGLMGSHASQLSQRDRWLVIEYIKVLQNGGTMPTGTATADTLQPAPAAPAGATAMMN
jgi:mono/diheme cytochrome c family protein